MNFSNTLSRPMESTRYPIILKEIFPINIIEMSETRTIEEMTTTEIKEQLALYQRIYYHRMKLEDPDYMARRLESKRRSNEKLKAKRQAEGKSNRKYHGEPLILIKAEANN